VCLAKQMIVEHFKSVHYDNNTTNYQAEKKKKKKKATLNEREILQRNLNW
jgi:hypothetical protein